MTEDGELEIFLASCGLPHLRSVLDVHTLPELALANAESRAQFLSHLREAGVQKQKDRQALANALCKRDRMINLLPLQRALFNHAPAPMVVQSTYGLGNQLRVLLSYRAVAMQQGRLLVLVWHNCSAACPARFRDLFEPIDGVVVIDSLSELEMVHPELSRAHPSMIPSTYFAHPAVDGTPEEISMWKPLRPVASLRDRIEEIRSLCGPEYVAVHIRRTDHHCDEAARTRDPAFDHFLEQHTPCDVYLATDNHQTQQDFVHRYGARIKGLAPIETGSVREMEPQRHTPVAQAVIDIFCCVHARSFKGSFYSSFSDAIQQLRCAHNLQSPADEHDLATEMQKDRNMLQQDASVVLNDAWQAARRALDKESNVDIDTLPTANSK